MYQGCVVNIERGTPDSATLKLCPTHASANPLDNERPLKLGDGRNDDHDRSSEGTLRIDRFALGQELDPDFIEFIEYLQEMLSAAG